MPIYEYECKSCRHRFDIRQRIADDPIRVCPDCQGETRRVLQPVGIIFKGSGWYSTDHRKSSDNASSESSAPAKSESSDKTEKAAKSEPGSAASSSGESSKNDGKKESTSSTTPAATTSST